VRIVKQKANDCENLAMRNGVEEEIGDIKW